MIGVTVNLNQELGEVVLGFNQQTAPYVLTKPLHHSQKIVERHTNGIIISLFVQHNHELEKEILSFGDSVKVLSPEKLKRCIKDTLSDALDQYNYEIHHARLENQIKKLTYNGFSILQHVYTKKEMNHVKAIIAKYFPQGADGKPVHGVRNLMQQVPGLKHVLFNRNLKAILSCINPGLFLTKAIYFDKPPLSNWYVTWHQDTTITVKEKIETEGFFGWIKKEEMIGVCPPEEVLKSTLTLRIHLDDSDERNGALKVIPGSQNKRLSNEEIALITQSSLPFTCEVGCGGVHLMKPLLLHSSSKTVNQKHRRVVHLEFTTVDLPNGLQWAEKIEF